MKHAMKMKVAVPLLLAMAITSCSNSSIKTTLPEQVEIIRDKIDTIEQYVPSEFLIECEGLYSLSEPSMEALAKTSIENMKRFKECRARHNNWIEWHLNKLDNKQEIK